MNDLDFSASTLLPAPKGEPRTNAYKGACLYCGTTVKPSAGYVVSDGRKWLTLCKSKRCYAATFGQDAADSVGRRWIDAAGVLHMPHDKAALPLVRALATWDHDKKHWQVLTGLGDMPLVEDLAERLEVELPPEWKWRDEPASVTERVKRAAENGARGYQLKGVRWLALHERACLADDMGLGKSMQLLHALSEDEGLVVVCPAVAKGVWLREIAKWLPERFDNVVVCTGRGSFRWPASPRECVILNYDILPPQPSEKSKHASAGKPSCPVTIVADEAHYLKNNKAQRTKRFRSLAAHGSHVYGATGTPVESKPTELWGVLTSLGCNAMSWTAFLRAFNGYKGTFGLEFGRDALGAILVEPGTTELLSRTMLRRTKAEVAQELPPKVYSEHVVPISPKIVKQLDELAAVWADYLLADELPPFEAMAGVRKVLAQTRIAEAEKLVAEYEEQGVPVVVFSAHRAPAEALAKRKGWGSIIGGMKAADRTAMEDAFQDGKLKGLACTIRAAGTAITLTKASSMIFVDLDWNPSANTQAEDRCHRIGQDASSVDIVRMVSDHPLDRHVAYLLHTKSTFVDATLHGRVELSAASQPAKLVDEDESAWSQRVSAKQTQDEQRERGSRTKALREIASRGSLTPAQAEQRASLRLQSRGANIHALPTSAVQEAFEYMLSVCDGAQEKDDHGFNSPDAAISRWVAPAVRAGSPAALTCAYTMLRHYPRQLSARWGELFA